MFCFNRWGSVYPALILDSARTKHLAIPPSDQDSNGPVDPDWESGSGFGSSQAKVVPRNRKKLCNFKFEEFAVKQEAFSEAWMSFVKDSFKNTTYMSYKKNLGLDPHSEKMSGFRFGFSEFFLLGNQGKYRKRPACSGLQVSSSL